MSNFLPERQLSTATPEQAIVAAEVADKLEMFAETRFMQHPPGIAANRKDAPRLNVMMLVERKAVWVIRDGAAVDYRLPVVFAGGFHLFQLKQAVGRGIEADIASAKRELGVGNIQRPVSNQARVGEALPMGDP